MKRLLLIVSSLCFVGAILIFVIHRKIPAPVPLFSVNDVEQLFPRTVDEIDQRVDRVQRAVSSQVEALLAIAPINRTFANTVQAYDDACRTLWQERAPIEILVEVDPSVDLRNAAGVAAFKLVHFSQKVLENNKQIYGAFQDYIEQNVKKEPLTEEQRYFLVETMHNFKKNGLNLPQQQLEHVLRLNGEIEQLIAQFAKNISQDASRIECTRAELDGLPNHIVYGLARTAADRYIVNFDMPTVAAILKHVRVAQTRKKVYEIFGNKAYPKNYAIIKQLVAKRDQLAKLLGFASYSAYDIDGEMARTPQAVDAFLLDLNKRLGQKITNEFSAIIKHTSHEIKLNAQKKIEAWDALYAYETYKKNQLGLDDDYLMRYFPVDHVLHELCNIAQEFFPLRFERVPSIQLWHEDVSAVAVYETSTNRLRGYLLFDVYQRAGKYPHACELEARSVQCIDGACLPGVVLVIANVPRRANGRSGLLPFEEVATIIHEFGHAMHAFLSSTRLYSFAGVVVKTDFSEVPSQLFERFLFEPAVLCRLSKHYKTGERLSDDLVKRLVRSELCDAGYVNGLLVGRALFLLKLYEQHSAGDIDALYRKYVDAVASDYVASSESTHFAASFLHVPEYGPKYYSYMWSKVFVSDVYEEVRRRGGLCLSVGRRFADDVLSKGGSVDPEVLIERFLGRSWRIEPFFTSLRL